MVVRAVDDSAVEDAATVAMDVVAGAGDDAVGVVVGALPEVVGAEAVEWHAAVATSTARPIAALI